MIGHEVLTSFEAYKNERRGEQGLWWHTGKCPESTANMVETYCWEIANITTYFMTNKIHTPSSNTDYNKLTRTNATYIVIPGP